MGFMTLITVPYGSTELSAEIPDRNFLSTILPHSAEESGGSPSEIIRRALENPIGTKRLCEMAGPSDRIALFVNDITRPTPTAVILPFVLEELGKAGVPDENITIYFALGLHRSLTEEECIKITGEEIYRRIRCVQPVPCSRCDLIVQGFQLPFSHLSFPPSAAGTHCKPY